MGHVGNLAAVVAGFVLVLVLGLRFLSIYASGRT
ncbi:MAG: hypothetical protein QOE71_1283, partial [Pseudonocardiales bacterium]|nr:hypothetical protein [Pseudonocardiales bacterium]